jgi:heme A synthase
MANKKLVVSLLSLLVLIEYVLGGLVSFDDASDRGFQLTSHALNWPGVLPFAHRFFAVVLVAAWLIGSRSLRGSKSFRASHATLGLMVVQCIIGTLIPYTLQHPTVNAYIIIAHFGVSGLVIIETGFTWFYGWYEK